MKYFMNTMLWVDNAYEYTLELKQPFLAMAIIVVLPVFAVVLAMWYFAYQLLVWRKYIINDDGGQVGIWARNNGYTVIELTHSMVWISNTLMLYTLSKK